jgi:hypothetical protein
MGNQLQDHKVRRDLPDQAVLTGNRLQGRAVLMGNQ